MDEGHIVVERLARQLESVPRDAPDRPELLSQAAGELLEHGELELARAWLEEAVAAVSPEAPERLFYLSNLGVVHEEVHAVSGDPASLDRAVECFATAASRAPADDPDLPMYLNNLANVLTGRALPDDAGPAVDAAVRAVDLTPRGSPDRPLYENTLGNALYLRYEAEGAAADLDAAVRAYEEAAEDRGSDVHAMSLANLGSALSAQAANTGQDALMDRAISACEAAVRATAATSPDLGNRLAGLADVLRESHVAGAGTAPLERAVSIYESVLSSAEPRDLPGHWNNLANCLRDRFAATGSRADLDRAIALSRQALDVAPGKPLYLGNLASGLRARYLLLGDEADLREALDAYGAAASAPGPVALRARWLNNLGNGFHGRYVRTGELDDLGRAIDAYRRAHDLVPATSADLPRIAGNLGAALAERHDVTGVTRDLGEAVALLRGAVDASAPRSPQRALYLDNLGTALVTSFHGTGDRDLLDEAVRLHREAASVPGPDQTYRLGHYGVCLMARAAATGSRRDVRAAVRVLRRTVERAEPTDPHLPRYTGNLANAHRRSYALSADDADLHEAVRLYRRTCSGTSASIVVLRAAKDWAVWAGAREAWVEVTEAGAAGLPAMEGLVAVQAAKAGKEVWLREAQELANTTAYAYAVTGAPRQAVTAAERGRAVLLSETIEREKARLARLEETGHDRLVERYRRAVTLLAERTRG